MDPGQRQATLVLNSRDKKRAHVERKAFLGLIVVECNLAVFAQGT